MDPVTDVSSFRPRVPARAGSRLRGRTAGGLSDVEPSAWDELVPRGEAVLGHAYLRAWECGAELPGLAARPVIVSAAGTQAVVAACPGFVYELDLAGARLPSLAPVLRAVRNVRPGFLTARTYELGSPTPLTNPLLVRDERIRPEAVRAIGEAALEEARRCGATFVMVQNFADPCAPAVQELRPLGFSLVPILPTVVVPLEFSSFDEYLRAMRSQYRRRAHQVLERSAELEVEHLRDFGHLADELARLWHLIFERARELRREVLTASYFAAMSSLEGSSVLVLRRPDRSIASFALLFADHPWLSFLQCGFDAEAARGDGAYFRLLYEIVRLGIEGGYRHAELGMTTVDPKLDVGGVPVPLYALLRHRNRLAGLAIARLASGRLGPPQVEARRVFKAGAPTAQELVAARGKD